MIVSDTRDHITRPLVQKGKQVQQVFFVVVDGFVSRNEKPREFCVLNYESLHSVTFNPTFCSKHFKQGRII